MGIPEYALSEEEQKVLDHILDLALEVAQAESGSLILRDRKGELYLAAGRGIRREYLGMRVGNEEGSISALVFERREPIVIDAGSPYPDRRQTRKHASVSLPVFDSARNVIGVLNLNALLPSFPREELPRLSALAESIGLLLAENLLRRQHERRILALSEIVSLFARRVPCASSENEAFAKLSDAVRVLTGASQVAIFRFSPRRSWRVFTLGWPKELTWRALSLLQERVAFLFEERVPRFLEFQSRSLLALPFAVQKARHYVLFAFCDDTLDILDFLLLSVVSALAESCLENLRLLEETKKLTREAERSRLARELHDGLAQVLASEQIYLHFLSQEVGKDRQLARELLEKVRNLNTIAIEESRFILSELKGKPVSSLELQRKVEEVIESFLPPGIAVEKKLTLPSGPLAFRVYRTVVAVLQEALSNVAKHAQAKSVRVVLEALPGAKLRLLVEDDGVGFTPKDVGEGHFGLMNLRLRLRTVRGRLRISSSPGKGTKVEALIPLEEVERE